MTIILLLLGISFLCALTLVGACIVSARSSYDSEDIMRTKKYDEQGAMSPSVSPLHTTTRATS